MPNEHMEQRNAIMETFEEVSVRSRQNHSGFTGILPDSDILGICPVFDFYRFGCSGSMYLLV